MADSINCLYRVIIDFEERDWEMPSSYDIEERPLFGRIRESYSGCFLCLLRLFGV